MENIHKENSLSVGVTSIKEFDICMDSIKARFSDEKKKNENLRFVLPLDYEGYIQLLTQFG